MGSESFEFSANVWNWKAALEVIKNLDIISDGKVRQMSYNAMGVKVDMDEAHLIGEKIRGEVLPRLQPDKRIYADGTVTDESTRKFLTDYMAELHGFITRVYTVLPRLGSVS